MEKKVLFQVEKFLPPECPKCRHKFEKQNDDWSLLMGDIVDGKKVVRETKGYDIIICTHCGNYTARFPLESFCLSDREQAERLLELGFVNLQEVESYGSGPVEESHTICGFAPNNFVKKVCAE